MTYALRQQFQEMDRSVQADERQKLADLAATQKRNDEAAQRRILSQAHTASFDLPDGYQFGTQAQNVGAPGVSNIATSGGPAYKPRAGAGRQQTTENQSAAESSRLARQAPRTDVDMDRLANLRRQQMMGSVLKPEDTKYIADNRGVGQTTGPTGRPIAAPQAGRNEAAFQELQRLNAQPPAPAGSYSSPAAYAAHVAANPVAASPSSFVDRIRQAESAGNPNAVGRYIPGQGTAKGDMQVMDKTNLNPGFGVVGARDNSPEERSRVGREYAQALLQRYGNEAEAAAAYNWGPGNYDQWKAAGGNIAQMPAETRAYVARVTGGAPQGAQGPQQAAAPRQAPEATYTGMGPGGSPQMLQEQIQMAQFRYNQLSQMLQNAPPEQQEKIAAEMRTLHAGARAQQAYMLAAQADGNPQALGQLVALAGAQAARTADGHYVMVGVDGRAVSQPMTGGQLGAKLFEVLDAKSREARADMQGKIALEQAKALAQAQAKLMEQGGTTAEVEQLKALMQAFVEQSKSKGYGALMDPMKGLQVYSKDTGQPSAAMQMPDTVTIR